MFASLSMRRVAVSDETGEKRLLAGVITQSAILRFLRKHLSMLGNFGSNNVSQFLAHGLVNITESQRETKDSEVPSKVGVVVVVGTCRAAPVWGDLPLLCQTARPDVPH